MLWVVCSSPSTSKVRVSSIDCKGSLSSSTIVRGRRCLNMFPIDHGRSSQYILFYSITTICTNSHLISQAFFCQPRNGAWHGTEESIHTFLSPSPCNIILLPQVEKEEPTSRCQIYLISFSCCFWNQRASIRQVKAPCTNNVLFRVVLSYYWIACQFGAALFQEATSIILIPSRASSWVRISIRIGIGQELLFFIPSKQI